MEPKLVSVAALCIALGIGKTKAYELLQTDLESVRIGRRRLILMESIDAFIVAVQAAAASQKLGHATDADRQLLERAAINRIRSRRTPRMKFPGTYADLVAWINSTGFGDGGRQMVGYDQLFFKNGVVINWWHKTGSVSFQGPTREKFMLIASLAAVFDDPDTKWPQWLGEENLDSTKALAFLARKGGL